MHRTRKEQRNESERNRQMKIYISGPITGHDMKLVEGAFAHAENEIVNRGHSAVNPYELSKQMPEDSTWHDYMKNDIPELVKCDAIYMLPGWVYSSGCNLEYSIARTLGLTVFDQTVRIPFAAAKRREYRETRKTT